MIDYTRINDISRHRYRFWFMFPWGDMIENVFAVPGSVLPERADELARAAWAESLRLFVGKPIPAMPRKRFVESMAAEAAVKGDFVVLRPGEEGEPLRR
ncbi:hypothetical protein [Nostoc phage Nsp-JY18]